jgi:hypothetical protein
MALIEADETVEENHPGWREERKARTRGVLHFLNQLIVERRQPVSDLPVTTNQHGGGFHTFLLAAFAYGLRRA